MTHLTMQKGSSNAGPGKQLPHNARPNSSRKKLTARSKVMKIKPLKTKSKTAVSRTRPSRTSTRPLQTSGVVNTDPKITQTYTNNLQTTDSFQTENPRQMNKTIHTNSSVLISGSDHPILSSARLSRPGKRRASTPISFHGETKKSKLDYITLSPIKEDQKSN